MPIYLLFINRARITFCTTFCDRFDQEMHYSTFECSLASIFVNKQKVFLLIFVPYLINKEKNLCKNYVQFLMKAI